MIPPHDPFSDIFDAIEIDPARAPSADAIDRALAFCAAGDASAEALLVTSAAAPDLEAPGFYLLDDAQGRFIVDRDTGIVLLRDEGILESEHGQLHHARLRVVELSGHAYTLDLSLRLTGRVPQMAGAEDLLADFAPEAAAPPQVTAPTPEPQTPVHDDTLRLISWADFSATFAAVKPILGSEHAPFGGLIAPTVPSYHVGFAGLTIVEDVPAPHIRTAIYSL